MPAGPLLYGSYPMGSPELQAQRELVHSYARGFFRGAMEVAFQVGPWANPVRREQNPGMGEHCMETALRWAGLPV